MARVLYAPHDDPTSGHSGVSKTLCRFRQKFTRPKTTKVLRSKLPLLPDPQAAVDESAGDAQADQAGNVTFRA